MQSKNILLVLALASTLLAFPQGEEGMRGKKHGNGMEGRGSFFLANATETTKTEFKDIMKNGTLSRNAKSSALDAVIAGDSGEGVQSGYATFKADMTADIAEIKSKVDAAVAAANLTTTQMTLFTSLENIFTNGDLSPSVMRNETETIIKNANKDDLKALEKVFIHRGGFKGQRGGFEDSHENSEAYGQQGRNSQNQGERSGQDWNGNNNQGGHGEHRRDNETLSSTTAP